MERKITDNLDGFMEVLPLYIAEAVKKEDYFTLVEVIMDFGRPPFARFVEKNLKLTDREVSMEDIHYVISRLSDFGDDNRAGIERTLHRISAIRNRKGVIIGLSCRVGRSVYGTIKIIEDIVQGHKSMLLLGRPGVGKTTMLREMARVLSDEMDKRVVIVDTSNEIAGDGDIPHPAIGSARRMQVTKTAFQHAVMIEAVENHTPEVIIIDEIGTELEAMAARTIAERGVQLIGTAHGNTLENLLINPTLSDLVGGVQAVTLGDDEAKRRGTQKTILERRSPPTFNVVIDIVDRHTVAVHHDTATAVDSQLRVGFSEVELRSVNDEGKIKISRYTPPTVKKNTPAFRNTLPKKTSGPMESANKSANRGVSTPRIFLYGLSPSRFDQVAQEMGLAINWSEELKTADYFVTTKAYFRNKPQKVRDAEAAGLPIYVLKNNAPYQISQFLNSITGGKRPDKTVRKENDQIKRVAREMEEAFEKVAEGQPEVELSPQSSYIRRLQHLIASQHQMQSISRGQGEKRRVFISASALSGDTDGQIDYAELEEAQLQAENAEAEAEEAARQQAWEDRYNLELESFTFDEERS